jgi:hypothetical protein
MPARLTFSLDELGAGLLGGIVQAIGSARAADALVPEAIRLTARLSPSGVSRGIESFRFARGDERGTDRVDAVFAWSPGSPWTLDIAPAVAGGPAKPEGR